MKPLFNANDKVSYVTKAYYFYLEARNIHSFKSYRQTNRSLQGT